MPGFNPDQPRDAEGRWTDAGGAIQRAASDRDRFPELAFAPYRALSVHDEKEDAEIRNREQYKVFQEAVSEVAAGLGIRIIDKADTWGGYIDSETKIPVQEVSNIIHVDGNPDDIELLAAVIGKSAPEMQDSVLVSHHKPTGEGAEVTIRTGSFEKARQAMDSMKEHGIQYFSVNTKNGDIILLDTDGSMYKNIGNFVETLQKRGLYEDSEFSNIEANFIQQTDYDGILQKYRDKARSKNGFDPDAFIKKSKERYQKIAL